MPFWGDGFAELWKPCTFPAPRARGGLLICHGPEAARAPHRQPTGTRSGGGGLYAGAFVMRVGLGGALRLKRF